MLLPKRISPLTSSPETAKSEPAKNSKLPGVRRWSSRPTITRSWRIGSVPLSSISISLKNLGARVAVRIAELRAPRQNPILRVQDLPPRGTANFDARLKQDIAANLHEMLVQPTREKADEDGICDRFASDVLRQTEIVDQSTFPEGLQALLPRLDDQTKLNESTSRSLLKDFAKNNFQGNKLVMEVFTRACHQGAFGPIEKKLAALLRLCTYDTVVQEAPAVVTRGKTRVSFTLLQSSIQDREASLLYRMDQRSPQIMISTVKDESRVFNDKSYVSTSTTVRIGIKLDQILPAQQGKEKSEESLDTKHTAGDSRPRGTTESLTTYPSRFPSSAVSVEVLDGNLLYNLRD